MRDGINKFFAFLWNWYYKTNTNPVDGELSSRSQAYLLVVLTGCVCLVRECWKHEITRDWVEGYFVLMSGVAATKVWKRGESNAKPGEGTTG